MTISTLCHAAVRALLAIALAGILVVLPAGPVDAGSAGPRQGSVNGGQDGGKGGGSSPSGQKPGQASPQKAGSTANNGPSTGSGPAPKVASSPSSPSSGPAPGNTKPGSAAKASVGGGAPAPGHRKPGPAGKPGSAGKAGGMAAHDTDDAEPVDSDAGRAAPAPSTTRARTGSVVPAATSTFRFGGSFAARPAPAVPEAAAPVAPDAPAPALGPSVIDRALDLLPEPGETIPALRDPTIPMLLVVALAAYALIVGRGDRRDPKLARSSVDTGPRGIGFR